MLIVLTNKYCKLRVVGFYIYLDSLKRVLAPLIQCFFLSNPHSTPVSGLFNQDQSPASLCCGEKWLAQTRVCGAHSMLKGQAAWPWVLPCGFTQGFFMSSAPAPGGYSRAASSAHCRSGVHRVAWQLPFVPERRSAVGPPHRPGAPRTPCTWSTWAPRT